MKKIKIKLQRLLLIIVFNKGLDLLSKTGKMVIIEPSTWLIELRQNIADNKSSQMKKYIV
jgi:hypothetical protein